MKNQIKTPILKYKNLKMNKQAQIKNNLMELFNNREYISFTYYIKSVNICKENKYKNQILSSKSFQRKSIKL